MNATCHRCGAVEPTENPFHRERIPFRGSRAYCPRCHGKLEEKVLLGIAAAYVGIGLLGGILLLLNPGSRMGHLGVNLCLFQLIFVPSALVHELAHALVGQWCGLDVLGIWIGRGKTLFRARCLGFETEFKLIPFGGFAFLTHAGQDRLRLRYFLATLAGPLANALVLGIGCIFIPWSLTHFETSIQVGSILLLCQALILVENLLPYRIQTAVGVLCTDGLSLLQLLFSRNPDVLLPRAGFRVILPGPGEGTWTR